jgi:hypothetical protein
MKSHTTLVSTSISAFPWDPLIHIFKGCCKG